MTAKTAIYELDRAGSQMQKLQTMSKLARSSRCCQRRPTWVVTPEGELERWTLTCGACGQVLAEEVV